MKVVPVLLAGLVGAAGCDRDPERPELVFPSAIIYGVVYDTVGVIHPVFTVKYEPTADPECAGPSLVIDTTTFVQTHGYYRKLIAGTGSCTRVIINAAHPETIPDTIRRTDIPFRLGAPDSVQLDAVLARRDLLIVRERALLGPGAGVPAVISVPDTVTRNQSFTVSSSHYGSRTCTALDPVEVQQDGNRVTLSPYVRTRMTGPCTIDLFQFTHTVQLTFTAGGPATVTIVGRDTTLTRPLFVR